METIFDIEADGLEPSEIFVLGLLDYQSGEFTSYTSERGDIVDGLLRLAEADLICGHYVLGYDIPVIERLSGGLIHLDRAKVVDTCDLSRRLFPGLKDHKLRTWGDILGFPKGDWSKFDRFYPEQVPYCEQDCRVTSNLLSFFLDHMASEELRKAA